MVDDKSDILSGLSIEAEVASTRASSRRLLKKRYALLTLLFMIAGRSASMTVDHRGERGAIDDRLRKKGPGLLERRVPVFKRLAGVLSRGRCPSGSRPP
jgi:hypothetical protein